MSSDQLALIRRVVDGYGKDPHRLMDVIRDVHSESGYISDESVEAIAKSLGILRAEGISERANIIVDEKGKVMFVKIYPISQLPDIEEIIAVLKA